MRIDVVAAVDEVPMNLSMRRVCDRLDRLDPSMVAALQ